MGIVMEKFQQHNMQFSRADFLKKLMMPLSKPMKR
jgi:hypothetical protein